MRTGGKGAAHVAERIAEMRRAFDVAGGASDLRESTETVAADAMRVHRGHNNLPELIEEPVLVERTTLVRAALDNLEQEAMAETPDKANAGEALGVIKEWFLTACANLGRKADRAIGKSIDWGVPAGLGDLMLNPDELLKVIELAERWLVP